MENLTKIDKDLLSEIADLHETPIGAYNIRKNGGLVSKNSSANIEIISKPERKGIEVRIKEDTKNESVHIPVIVTVRVISNISINKHPVIEQLCGNCHIKYIGSPVSRLVIQSQIQRYSQLLENHINLVAQNL